MLLIDPAKDKTLQAAIKSDRVMTLFQESGVTDHGVVGFEQGRSRQFLVFPKPLKPFLSQRIVGIKYELLEETPAPKKETAKKETGKQSDEPPHEEASTKKDREQVKLADEQKPAKEEKLDGESRKAVREDNVVKFQTPQPEKQPTVEAEEIKELKRTVREAMDALEQGKQVVAFNLLKRIVDNKD